MVARRNAALGDGVLRWSCFATGAYPANVAQFAMSETELTIVSLPDEMLLLVIRACNCPIRVCNGLPLFEDVKGLACLSKGLHQQLHRLQPLVGVPSLAVVQRPARSTTQDCAQETQHRVYT